MDLRAKGLEIDEKLKSEYYKWKAEAERLVKVIEAQNEILRSDEAKGDRSENAVFLNAVDIKEQSSSALRSFEERIALYDKIFDTYSTASYTPTGTIKIGSVVNFEIVGENKEFIVKVVPRKAGAPLLGAIQENSPLGRELLGKRAGDIVSCLTERGVWKYNIKEVY